ncbi:MAG: lytic murein transglycosylase, partial [Paracoccaceae bacterium]|nr:lytic murein transglycosylase [Paracoccaceae bacterium]
WAGEIGMVQMLPGDILENGIDGDGDGHVLLKSSIPDALMSGASMLRSFGWKRGEPWLVEVTVPDNLDWSLSGEHQQLNVEDWERLGLRARSGTLPLKKAQASLLLPMGHKGPAFLGYHNFHTLFEWNQSFTYVMTAAYFASRLEGAPMVDPRNPDPGLGAEDMMALQRRLQQRGHDVGKIDGILGAGTRTAVRAEQGRLGLPVDGWPTPSLLRAL